MNSVTAITDKILADAKAFADEQMAAANAEATNIKQEYEKQAEQETGRILEQARARVASIDERAKSQADMNRRQMMLDVRQQAMGLAFDAALNKLCALPDEEKSLLMIRLAVQYQTGDAELIFNAKERDQIGKLVVDTVNAIHTRQQLKETFSGSFMEQVKKLMSGGANKYKTALSDKVGHFAGGFILKQGDVENNCTFEVLVGEVREGLEGDVSEVLFG